MLAVSPIIPVYSVTNQPGLYHLPQNYPSQLSGAMFKEAITFEPL